jgi:farnesol dehydrogenase
MTRAFITGATGFIGGRLIQFLDGRDDFKQLNCLVRKPDAYKGVRSSKIKIIKGDITDPQSMEQSVAEADVIFHLAAYYELGIPKSNISLMEGINIQGTRNIFELARKHKTPKIIYVSTVYALGATGDKIADEKFPHCGSFTNHYERTKYEAHKVASQMIAEGMPIIIIMPSAVYGENDPSILGVTFKQLVQGKFPGMVNGTTQGKLTYVHVDDVISGIAAAYDKSRLGESYIIAGEVMTFQEMVNEITCLAESKPPGLVLPLWLARTMAYIEELKAKVFNSKPLVSHEALNSMLQNFAVSSDKAKTELGYQPRPNHQGFKETVEWIKENLG